MVINTSADQEESISHFSDWKRLLMLHVCSMGHADFITFILECAQSVSAEQEAELQNLEEFELAHEEVSTLYCNFN